MENMMEIAKWLKATAAGNFKLAGISSDGELFIETSDAEYFYSDKGAKQEAALSESLRQRFSNVKKITFVVKPSLKQLEQVIEDLNKLVLMEENPQPKIKLLDIEEF